MWLGPVLYLEPEQVDTGWRARSDLGDINQLAGSISKIGQLHPIAVTKADDGYQVVAGARRLAACKQLGVPIACWQVAPADEHHQVELQLEENVARKDFDALEIAEGLKRLKSLFEGKYPETKHGATGGGLAGKGTKSKADLSESDNPVERFTLRAAASLGCGETKVKEYLQMADLPKREKTAIAKAPTTTARNRLVRSALRTVRIDRKREKLRELAAVIAAERDEAAEEGPRVVLRLGDNAAYFDDADLESVELFLTDAPYDQRQSLVAHATRTSIDTNFGAWDKLDVGWVLKAAPLLVVGGQIVAFCPLEAIGAYKLVAEAADLTWRGALIWHKTNPGTVSRPVYLSSCEAIVWMTKGGGYTFAPWENAGAPEVHNFIEGPICGGNERLDHPTQKPEWLLERLLKQHTNPHSRVVDPFAGVGSTLVVCKRLGLPAIGVEQDPGYVHQARLRLSALA